MELRAVLVGENSIHAFDAKEPLLRAVLGDGVAVDITTDTTVLEALPEYDVLVDYLTDNRLANAEIEGLSSFVADSGGYLPIHCAADLSSHVKDGTFVSRHEPVPGLQELVGGYFLDPPEQSKFTVEIVDDSHPVTDGVSTFEVFDEPYQVTWDADRVQVLARMGHLGLDEAYLVVWVSEVGDSRVCYSSLGHTDAALEHNEYRQLLSNAVRWVTGD
jgi:type 1 glutamine amidotransferase